MAIRGHRKVTSSSAEEEVRGSSQSGTFRIRILGGEHFFKAEDSSKTGINIVNSDTLNRIRNRERQKK